ncbi:hypothetical protein SARC_08506 [Sphaeroforma arctica JP610]|uniref:Dolichyl-diphosphooligosaccharide--protein glycosyltransferase subunit OST2 n=1 Tax=Sphaeroforma arctica JP610 TaxID=667725 RepID=A0A0L0FQY5_9EUKA|nr:hypothetical protein SARC_08506 [Sphaeroforma arctica JP610]KNC79094.1 hypothetical protein SARC_08506 [Sphaeroforma arctica JP610]|eukprot:XP_014152996.1 hypothetical protein SARC_08506 [Sphaeroforma arctica JP610]
MAKSVASKKESGNSATSASAAVTRAGSLKPASNERHTLGEAVNIAFAKYNKVTPGKLKAIDCFLVYVMAVGVIQFVYACLVGTDPFNSFLAGFLSCIGTFVLTVSLRMQAKEDMIMYPESTPKRAFADYILCNAILHIWVLNFMG